MTTKGSQSTTKPHWSNEAADAAVQAAIEAQALMLATALALGLPGERVEDAPQEAERLRTHLAQIRAILAGLLADAGIEVTDDVVRLAVQVRAQVRALEAERDELVADRAAIVEALLSVGFETASGDPVQLAAQVRELVRALESVIERAIHSMRWLWGFWDGNTVIPAPSADREMVAQAWEGLAMAVGDLVEALGHDPDPSKRGKLDERVEVVSP